MTTVCALAQISPLLGNLDANLRKHTEMVERAIDGGADLIVFPELSLSGYTVRDMHTDLAMLPSDPRLDRFRELSSEIVIVLGGVETTPDFSVHNSAFVFDEGRVQTYRKLYPPDYGIFEERRYFLPGTSARTIETRVGRLGVLICEDLWHLSLPLLQALEGAQLLCVLSASPTRMVGNDGLTNYALNHQHHATICRLLSVNMAFVNRTGFEDGVNFWGGSEAVDATGAVIISAGPDDEQMLFAEFKSDAVRRARTESRHFLDEDVHLLSRELQRVIRTRGEGGA
jgi:predicted amidohydrolase